VTKAFRAALAVLLMLTIGLCLPGSTSLAQGGPLTGHVRIMIAGDSIAAGVPVGCGGGTYIGERQVLGDWLTRVAGLDVEFVGSVAATCGAPFHRSEGWPTETIRGLANRIGGMLAASPAEILILRVGVNDATDWSGFRTAEQMATDYRRLIDNARSARPGIRILAGEIIPPEGAVSPALARASVTSREFNAMLPGIAADYAGAVRVAEFGRITAARLSPDGLHPNPFGYVDMAWILMEQPDGLWSWLSNRPPPATRPWDIVQDPWR
jgi:hypothetical protein